MCQSNLSFTYKLGDLQSGGVVWLNQTFPYYIFTAVYRGGDAGRWAEGMEKMKRKKRESRGGENEVLLRGKEEWLTIMCWWSYRQAVVTFIEEPLMYEPKLTYLGENPRWIYVSDVILLVSSWISFSPVFYCSSLVYTLDTTCRILK